MERVQHDRENEYGDGPANAFDSLLRYENGLPHLDAERTNAEREKRGDGWLSAAAGHWLKSLADALGGRFSLASEGPVQVLGTPADLTRVLPAIKRGVTEASTLRAMIAPIVPISPLAMVSFDRDRDYFTFVAAYYPDEGHWAASGGVYLSSEHAPFPCVAFRSRVRDFIEEVVSHEMTHHIVHDLGLPVWLEEGLTKMIQERASGKPAFWIDAATVAEQRALWAKDGLGKFWSGSSFHSPRDQRQRLSYHLAQWLVRKELEENRQRFFRFVKGCVDYGDQWAAAEHFGQSRENWARASLGLPLVPEPRLRANTPLLPHPHILRFDVTTQDWDDLHRIAGMADAEPGPLGPAEVRIMEYGVVYAQGSQRLPFAWCCLTGVQEHSSGMVLQRGPAFLHIPNRAFEAAEHRRRVLAIARLFAPAQPI
jgi:hypothetical protein